MKTLPHNHEIEKNVLGTAMVNPDALFTINEILFPEAFHDFRNEAVFLAIRELYDASRPVDIVTVSNALKTASKLEGIGGAVYVAKLTDQINITSVEYNSRIIIELWMLREMARLGAELSDKAITESDAFEVDDYLTKEQLRISEAATKSSSVRVMREVLPEVRTAIYNARNEQGMTGITTGNIDKDRVYGGRQGGDLIIKAGRPAMGKTADALCEALAAAEAGKNVLFFSLEMPTRQLVSRLVNVSSGVPNWKTKTGKLTEFDQKNIELAIGRLENLPLHIVDDAYKLRDIVTVCMRVKQKKQLDIVFVDYIQLVEGVKDGNREQEVSSISRKLKLIAKELNVPVIALSQLSRSVETRGGDKRPQLSDLRESGAIEQDADIVEFLYRPEYYGITEYDDGTHTAGIGELIVAKHRNGSLANIRMLWEPELTRFSNYKEGLMNSGMSDFEDSF